MTGIVCAIRGGPESQPTITEAINLAKKTGMQLYFLYIVNLDFLAHTMSSRVQEVSLQMEQMGEFILMTAQSKAETRGVEAETRIRHGKVRLEIIGLCQEIEANYLVLGRPAARGEEVFDEEMLTQFVERISEETGATVVLAGGGESGDEE